MHGANSYGQLGLGHKEDVLLPQQLSDFCKPECIRRITGGGGHSAVVTDGGGLFVCGLNKDGQLGLGHTEDVLYFTACRSLLGCPILQVACGWDFTIILTESGQVLSCGSNCFGQLGVPHGPRRCVVPQAIELLREKVVCIAAGLRHALAATANGIVFQWGTGLASSGRRLCPGQTLPPFLTAREPSRVTGLENSKVTCVLAGSDHSASLTDAGELYVWGSNKHGQLASLAAFLPMPQKIEAHCFQNEKVTSVWSGWTHLVAQTETGKVFTWGRADYGQLGRKLASPEDWKLQSQDPSYPHSGPRKSMPSPLHCLTGATEISCGSEHNLAVIGGTCYSWGWNEHGMCGDGSEDNIWAPKPVQALRSSLGLLVGCGAGHSLALCHLPVLPELGQHPKVTGSSPDATEDAESQEAMDKERNWKERQPEASAQSQYGRSRNGGLVTEAL
ncbi:secretion-regulating guanine nucleotide exchange factor isoform X3 [Mustela nigripes]|uniref:secretion-regulating guanine nucleotide exchange factor isoform X3 n=1 Tax=Mustela lutreola TaxID=9666 RepID=UPI0003447537|nr:secretion-regulating guanine nucleotide exchange factor isoform X3 [Mustela lutreola]XP_059263533.1 secretion-regulating guanine nucleotide exchange factor isoform X3 [Mustela nigripes]XP_059263537.1 secretion-regulating guanine nucleotide exchange factor isoform X3 [Mustela nigripes]